MEPNIFDYATTELSQDAVLAYIFAYADKSAKKIDKDTNEMAVEFVKLLIERAGEKIPSIEIEIEDITKQWNLRGYNHKELGMIDLWIDLTINDKYYYAFIIEDKTGTECHDDQLVQYKKNVKFTQSHGDFAWAQAQKNRKPLYFYIQTGYENRNNFAAYEKNGFNVILRKDILSALSKAVKSKNTIFRNFMNYLESFDEGYDRSSKENIVKNIKLIKKKMKQMEQYVYSKKDFSFIIGGWIWHEVFEIFWKIRNDGIFFICLGNFKKDDDLTNVSIEEQEKLKQSIQKSEMLDVDDFSFVKPKVEETESNGYFHIIIAKSNFFPWCQNSKTEKVDINKAVENIESIAIMF